MKTLTQTCRIGVSEPRARQQYDDGRVRFHLDSDLGNCYSEHLELEEGLVLGRLHYHPTRPIVEETHAPHGGQVMVMTIGMEGKSGYLGADASNIVFQAGHTTTTTFGSVTGVRKYEAGQTASQLRVVVHERLLSRYVGEQRAAQLLGSGRLHHLDFRASSAVAMAHASALVRYLQPSAQGQINRLDLQIHALSLLSEQVNLLAPVLATAPGTLTTQDIARLERARNLLCEQLHSPLTVEFIATTVGMNEHKLKQGFHTLFNTTPMAMLLELRMRKAYTLLESGQQVAQAAWQVGYKYANNFTVAFTRYYGRSPKSIFGKKCAPKPVTDRHG
jgi:AraC family transcriptional activator of pyochelin receptor